MSKGALKFQAVKSTAGYVKLKHTQINPEELGGLIWLFSHQSMNSLRLSDSNKIQQVQKVPLVCLCCQLPPTGASAAGVLNPLYSPGHLSQPLFTHTDSESRRSQGSKKVPCLHGKWDFHRLQHFCQKKSKMVGTVKC